MNNITIIKECSTFLKESKGEPLIKLLPNEGNDIRKIKVRKRKNDTEFDQEFNSVFSDHSDLRARCVMCNGRKGIPDSYPENKDQFYIFPINGYKFLASLDVSNSKQQYSKLLEDMEELLGEDNAINAFIEVIKYDYSSEDIRKYILHGSEIIIYGIPYFYAIRHSSVKNYSTLFSL